MHIQHVFSFNFPDIESYMSFNFFRGRNISYGVYILRSMLLEVQRPYVLIFPSVGPSSMQASQNILTAFATR